MNTGDTEFSQTGFSSIIREISSSKGDARDPGSLRFILDETTGEIVERASWLSRSVYRYFEVKRNEVAFNLSGPEVEVRYDNSVHPFIVKIKFDAKLAPDKSPERLIRLMRTHSQPLDAVNARIKERLSEYIFSLQDFVQNFSSYRKNIQDMVLEEGKKMGLSLHVYIESSLAEEADIEKEEFIRLEHVVAVKTKDAQSVDIKHDLALTLSDPMKLALSRITDVAVWAKKKLEQFTGNAIIEKNYSEVLTSLPESLIKGPMQEVCRQIGYELKQLVTGPGLDMEKFYFETADPNQSPNNTEYVTKEPKVKIALNMIVSGRLDLQHTMTRDAIKPGRDILTSMRRIVIESTRDYINDKTPEMCFLNSEQIEKGCLDYIKKQLQAEYAFNELSLLVKFLETDLARRFRLLQERPYKIEVKGNFNSRKYEFWFRVVAVDKDGWFRFLANNYNNIDEELAAMGNMLRNGLETNLRPLREVNSELIVREFDKIRQRIRHEFGLLIRLHDIMADLSEEELSMIRRRMVEIEEHEKQYGKIITYETNKLAILTNEYILAMKTGESDKVLAEIEEKIQKTRENIQLCADRFLAQSVNHDFLLPESQDDTQLNNNTNSDV